MPSIVSFDSIPVNVPHEKILRRLGYHKGITSTAPHQMEEIKSYIDEALPLIKLKGRGLRLPIERRESTKLILPENDIFVSEKLVEFLADCMEIMIFGATAGHDIMAAISENAEGLNMTKAVVLDAVASELVDASLDWIMKYFNRILIREKRRLLRKRFSAGYGDFSLGNQKTIFRLLKLDEIGLALTDAFMIIPEKSVTAVTGIQHT